MKRNIGMHTSADDAKRNILAFLSEHCRDASRLGQKSTIGYAAYPGYTFKSPQGAAFAVARIVRELADEGLVQYHIRRHPVFRRGYCITSRGLAAHAAMMAK